MASEGKDAEVDEHIAMDTSDTVPPDSEMDDIDQQQKRSFENVGTKTDPDLDIQMDSPNPEDVPPSSPCGISEEGLLDSSASSRASSDRGTPSKHGMRTPSGGGIGGGPGMADNVSTCSTSSSSSQSHIQGHVRGRCPNRPGIIWRKGEKVEAMDFMKKWYSAKIVDIDEEEATVLIHFEGWNQRYDEWVEMSSEKLRPKMRHSGRKEKKKRLSGEYKLGESVYARWTDCKMYPGKVTSVQTDGSYEIVFYDGFKKSVQPINIRPRAVDPKQKSEIINVPKELRRKSNEEEGVLPGSSALGLETETGEGNIGRRRSCHLRSKVNPEPGATETKSLKKEGTKLKQRKRPSAEGVTKRRETTEGHSGQRNKESGIVRKRSASATTSKKKLIVAGSFFARRERSDSDSVSVKSSSTPGGADLPQTGETTDSTQVKVEVKAPVPPVTKPATSSVGTASLESVSVPSSPASTASASTSLPAITLKQPPSQKLDPTSGVGGESAAALIVKREKKTKKRTASPSMSETSSTSESQSEVVEGMPARKRSRSKEKEKVAAVSQLSPSISPVSQVPTQGTALLVAGIPKKAFIIEQDHNHFKCVFEGCNKAFRKENLLDSHIKYYHCDDTKKQTVPQPTRKRRKTTSICSTDSDVSSSSKQTTPVAKTQPMPVDIGSVTLPPVPAPEVQDCVTVDIVEEDIDMKMADLKHQRTCSQDTMATEESIETEDELSKDEVVNCICLFNEENGLMIQCDVCLCWQHAVCFDLTVETLPKKYICFVCSDPTGVRESCRYIHEQEWIKHGNLTKFGFLNYQERDERRAGTIQATCGLVSDVHNISTVLHSLKEEIKLSRDHSHPQFKVWATDLDSEELCPEETGQSSFNQSNMVTDSDMNQSETMLHSKIDQSHTDSLLSQKDQSQTSLQTETHPPLISNITGGISEGGGLVIKTEPVDPSEISNECARTLEHKHSDNVSSEQASVKEKDTVDVRDSSSLSGDTVRAPTEGQSNVSLSTTTNRPSASQSDTGQPTASLSTASQITVPQPTSNHFTVNQSTVDQSTVIPPTSSQSTTSQSTESPPTGSQATDTEVPDSVPEAAAEQMIKTEVKEEVVEECQQEVGGNHTGSNVVVKQEDPFQTCESNLLRHIFRVQGQIDSRLDMIEEQVTALEAAEMSKGDNSCSQNALIDLPMLKKSLHMLQSDLVKVKRMAAYHR